MIALDSISAHTCGILEDGEAFCYVADRSDDVNPGQSPPLAHRCESRLQSPPYPRRLSRNPLTTDLIRLPQPPPVSLSSSSPSLTAVEKTPRRPG